MSEETNLHIGPEPELVWVPVDSIFVDHAYQRELKPALVKKILKNFSWAKFGCLSLAAHADGRYACIEGQHRLEAARNHPQVSRVPAAIFRMQDVSEEADAFLGINATRQAVSSVERYWAGLRAGDPACLRIHEVLSKVGCTVVRSGTMQKVGETNAVTAVGRALDRYGEKAVLAALATLCRAWPKDRTALSGTLIVTLARLYLGNPNIIVNRMVERLSESSRAKLTADAEAIRKAFGGSAETVIAKALVETYNKGLSKNLISIGVRR